MTKQIQRTLTPEQRELQRKRAELETLQSEFPQRELELTTLQATLEDFERRYLRIVGAKSAKLDELDARIANALTLLNPQDPATTRAAQARAQAEDSAQAWGGGEDGTESASQPFNQGTISKRCTASLRRRCSPIWRRTRQSGSDARNGWCGSTRLIGPAMKAICTRCWRSGRTARKCQRGWCWR